MDKPRIIKLLGKIYPQYTPADLTEVVNVIFTQLGMTLQERKIVNLRGIGAIKLYTWPAGFVQSGLNISFPNGGQYMKFTPARSMSNLLKHNEYYAPFQGATEASEETFDDEIY